jgi:hypothetical protein
MLNPIVRWKVIAARNGYLKAGKKEKPVARDLLMERAFDRYDLYQNSNRPHDAAAILKLATTKRGATPAEKRLLNKVRRDAIGTQKFPAQQPLKSQAMP